MLRSYTVLGNNDNLDRVVAPPEGMLMDYKKEILPYICTEVMKQGGTT
jgi:hypothetical protein